MYVSIGTTKDEDMRIGIVTEPETCTMFLSLSRISVSLSLSLMYLSALETYLGNQGI